MRIKVILKEAKNKAFKRDHYHQLAGMIYNMIRKSNPEFSSWLHEKGFMDGNKKFKFFCFSRLVAPRDHYEYIGENKELILFKSNQVSLYISSPIEEFLTNLIEFFLAEDYVKLGDHTLKVDSARALTAPDFGEKTVFKVITPIVLSKRVEGYNTPFYIRAYQSPDEFDEYLTKNAKEKWKIFTGQENADISLQVDRTYLEKKGKRTSCKINLSPNQTIIGSVVPVIVSGDPEIIRFLYDVGLGQKNSLGMGMVELAGYKY